MSAVIDNSYRGQVRRRILLFTPELLATICTTGSGWRVEEGLPQDTKVVGSGYDGRDNALVLYVESESFDLILEGQAYPKHQCVFTRLPMESNSEETDTAWSCSLCGHVQGESFDTCPHCGHDGAPVPIDNSGEHE